MPGEKNPKKVKKASDVKEYSKKTSYRPSNDIRAVYQYDDKITKAYKADKKGVVRSSQKSDVVTQTDDGIKMSYPQIYRSMDTTGYSKGKPTYTVKQYTKNTETYDPFSSKGYKESYTEKKIPRSQVKSTISKMKKGTK